MQHYYEVIGKSILLQVIHNQFLKKLKPLRALLRLGASGFAYLLALYRGYRFPPQWGWYPKLEFLLGLYEPATTSLGRRLIKPGMTVIDIGANVGYYTILFSRLVGPSGRVYAFEPHPEIFKLLKHNIGKRRNVVAIQKAVADANSEVEFSFSKRTTGSHGFFVPGDFLIGSCKVEAVRLDDFLRDEGLLDCDFVKIDVEGAEPWVIEGMSNLIDHSRRLIVILEFNPSCLRLGYMDPEEFLEMLYERFDFVYHVDEEGGNLRPVVGTTLIRSVPEWHAVNLLCGKGEVKL